MTQSAARATSASAVADSDEVRLAGGALRIGTDSSEIPSLMTRFGISDGRLFEAELPALDVRVAPFFLDRRPVTNERFFAFIAANPSWGASRIRAPLHNGHYLDNWKGGRFPEGHERYPVTFVSWYAATAYCAWRGERLPSETEWEFAARGGVPGEAFPWGTSMPDTSRANWYESGIGAPVEVGRYPPNGYGLYDMAGNVWNFLADRWAMGRDRLTASAASPASAILSFDERALASEKGRHVVRGGSYGAAAVNMRVRYRDSHPADGAVAFVGFRCARGG